MTIFVQVVFLAHALLVVMPPPLPASFARTQLRNSRWFEPSFDLSLYIQDGLRDAEDGTCEACQDGDYAVFALIATRMQDGSRRIVVSILRFPITPSNHHSTWRQARNNGQRHRKAKLTKQHFASIQGFGSAGCSDRVVHWFLGCSVQEQCSMGPRNRKRSSFDVRLRAFQLQYLVLKGNQDQLC